MTCTNVGSQGGAVIGPQRDALRGRPVQGRQGMHFLQQGLSKILKDICLSGDAAVYSPFARPSPPPLPLR